MLSKKAICSALFLIAVLLLATAPNKCPRRDLDKIQADGGAPPAPPIPWPTATGTADSPYLSADGGAPPAPPIPWPQTDSGQLILKADGGTPPAPPIGWVFTKPGVKSLAV
jgi:hypothetical protein